MLVKTVDSWTPLHRNSGQIVDQTGSASDGSGPWTYFGKQASEHLCLFEEDS